MALNRLPAAMMAVVGMVAAASAQAATITFDSADTGPFAGPVTENGYTYAASSGALFAEPFGNSGGDMEGFAAEGGGVLGIHKESPGAFTFSGLDFAAYRNFGAGSQTLNITGYLGGIAMGSDVFTLATTNIFSPSYSNWTHLSAVNLSGVLIDDLEISLPGSLTSNSDLSFQTYAAVDNVSLDAGGVPEPATWAMMMLGFAGLGAVLRARRSGLATA